MSSLSDPRPAKSGVSSAIHDPGFVHSNLGFLSAHVDDLLRTDVAYADIEGIVRRHKGSIAVRSESGPGTTVQVRLPLDAAPAGEVPERQPAP